MLCSASRAVGTACGFFRASAANGTFRSVGARGFAVYDSIVDTIGRTPVVRLNGVTAELAARDVQVLVKCEFFNPLGSVKDRLALALIADAEASGRLQPGQTVVEATSGNTGIALAMVCAAKGYPLVVTMAESFSVERRRVMRMLGARVVLTPAPLKGTGMVNKARELAEAHGYFLTSQFENPANAAFHASTTGPEILSDFAGRPLTHWVTGYGTGGTLQGAGKVIKAARPDVSIVVAEPTVAPLLASGEEQQRRSDGSPAASHPSWTPHPVQGWTPDFIPQLTEDARSMGLIDDLRAVAPPDAIATSHALARGDGIFTGISGGATVRAALDVAADAAPGSVILAMAPDTAERYMSTPLFGDIAPDMNDEELSISKSTPGYQLPEE